MTSTINRICKNAHVLFKYQITRGDVRRNLRAKYFVFAPFSHLTLATLCCGNAIVQLVSLTLVRLGRRTYEKEKVANAIKVYSRILIMTMFFDFKVNTKPGAFLVSVEWHRQLPLLAVGSCTTESVTCAHVNIFNHMVIKSFESTTKLHS